MASSPNKISKFIRKLLEILEDSRYEQIIKWTSDFTGVQIINRKQLETRVLADHFRLTKVTSFIRQLHLYGFHKSKNEKKANTFEHPLFFKSAESDFSLIKRKYKQKSPLMTNQMIETESSEQKEEQKETALPQLHSIKSLEDILMRKACFETCSNELLFQEWYMNEEQDFSFFLDDCMK